jgi:hypothetical protein
MEEFMKPGSTVLFRGKAMYGEYPLQRKSMAFIILG